MMGQEAQTRQRGPQGHVSQWLSQFQVKEQKDQGSLGAYMCRKDISHKGYCLSLWYLQQKLPVSYREGDFIQLSSQEKKLT